MLSGCDTVVVPGLVNQLFYLVDVVVALAVDQFHDVVINIIPVAQDEIQGERVAFVHPRLLP